MAASAEWDNPGAYPRHDLSPHQREVLLGIARGGCNQQIAEDLDINSYAVRNIITDQYDNLGLASRVRALF